MRNALQALLATLPSPALLVLGSDVEPDDVPEPPDGAVLSLREVLKDPSVRQPRGWRTVLWLTRDRASLRQDAAVVPRVGQCRTAGVWLLGSDVPVVLQPRGEWPALVGQRAEAGAHGAVTVVRLAGPVGAHSVLGEMARQAAPGADRTHGGVVVGYAGRRPAPGLDLRAPLAARVAGLTEQERDVPPDVVLAGPAAAAPGGEESPAEHHVTGRRPLVLHDRDGGAWDEPVDELVFHPRGWRKDWDAPVVGLAALVDAARRGGVPAPAPGLPQVTEDVVRVARAHQGVRLGLAGPDAGHPQDVARLAMAGVPLLLDAAGPTGTGPGADLREALPPALAEALASPVDLDDTLSREEHSVRTRRAAFDACSTLAWRAALARRAGVRWAHGAEQALPTVSILLATKRPHQLEFALRQVARQRGVRVELVLATHGFTVTEERVRQVLADAGADVPVTLVPCEADTWFGDVLSRAAQAASGELLMKMDDDDWYAADAVHDLVMARRYAGAEVVGMPSEFVYLEAAGVTVRRNHPTEQFARFIAGGTILIDRGLLRSLGMFRRVRRYVDAQLLSGVEAAGGRIYRTHGLGYILRRSASGHTWDMDDESFRRPEIVDREWPGFRTSSALVPDPRDLPGGADA